MEINCKDCQIPFPFTEGEQQWYNNKGMQYPKRCKECRIKAKERYHKEDGLQPELNQKG